MIKAGEVGLLVSVLLWGFVHPLQAEHHDLFIRKLGARGYLTSRYVLNLCWLGGNIGWSAALYDDSARLWDGSAGLSAALNAAATACLVAILLIPGSLVATNSKIAHSRHDDMIDGSHAYEVNPARASVQIAPAQLTSLCKLTNRPQLISVFMFIGGLLVGPTPDADLPPRPLGTETRHDGGAQQCAGGVPAGLGTLRPTVVKMQTKKQEHRFHE